MFNLSNRTNFCQQVRARTAEWNRGGSTFSVIFFNVKSCAHVANQSGMPAADMASMAAIKFLSSNLRGMDTVGLYAPGCFSLLLPSVGITQATVVCARLREEFSKFCVSQQLDPIMFLLGIGVVEISDTDDSISLLKRAEAALDAATYRGGNQTFYHDGERCIPIAEMLAASAS